MFAISSSSLAFGDVQDFNVSYSWIVLKSFLIALHWLAQMPSFLVCGSASWISFASGLHCLQSSRYFSARNLPYHRLRLALASYCRSSIIAFIATISLFFPTLRWLMWPLHHLGLSSYSSEWSSYPLADLAWRRTSFCLRPFCSDFMYIPLPAFSFDILSPRNQALLHFELEVPKYSCYFYLGWSFARLITDSECYSYSFRIAVGLQQRQGRLEEVQYPTKGVRHFACLRFRSELVDISLHQQSWQYEAAAGWIWNHFGIPALAEFDCSPDWNHNSDSWPRNSNCSSEAETAADWPDQASLRSLDSF